MAKRRKPKATPVSGSTQAPSSSGPRWMIVSAIRRTVASSSVPLADELKNPVIPHMSQIQRRYWRSTGGCRAGMASSYSVVFSIPIYKTSNSLFDRSAGLKAGVANQVIHVRISRGDVSGLKGEELQLGLPTQFGLQDLDEPDEFHRIMIADVVDPVRGGACAGVRAVAAPFGIGLGNPFHDADYTLDDVVNVGEVAPHFPVIVDLDRPPLQNGPREQEQGHVRPAPRTVDGEESQTRARQLVEMGVDVRHQLVGLLGRRVEAYGMVHVVMHRKWNPRVGAVHRARGGEHQVPYL